MDSATTRLLDAHLVQRGGYPFAKDDLSHEEWMALGVIAEEYRRAEEASQPTLRLGAGEAKK